MIQKCDLSIQQYALFVPQFVLPIFHIEKLLNSLLYTEFVIVLHMLLFTIVQLFINGLFSILLTTTLLSLVVVVVTLNLM
jgi:hypothetical protein